MGPATHKSGDTPPLSRNYAVTTLFCRKLSQAAGSNCAFATGKALPGQSPGPVLRVSASRDEQTAGLTRNIGRVPHARRVDRIFAGVQQSVLMGAIRHFLDQFHRPCDTHHHFSASGVHFPAGPVFSEVEERYKPAFDPVRTVALAVIIIPLHRPFIAREGGLGVALAPRPRWMG